MVNRANMLEIAVRNRSGYSEKVGDLGEATRAYPVKTGELRCDGRPDVDFIAELESNKPDSTAPRTSLVAPALPSPAAIRCPEC